MALTGFSSGGAYILIALFIIGCSPSQREITNGIAAAEAKCQSDGKFSGSMHEARSLLDTAPRDSFGYNEAADELIGRGFRFVEYERIKMRGGDDSRPEYFDYFHFNWLANTKKEKYVRLYLAPAGDENCEPFKRYMTMLPELLAGSLRWKGLKPDQCIALQRTDELQAEVEHITTPDATVPNKNQGAWGRWSIYRERVTQRTLGKLWTGGYRDAHTDQYYICQNKEEFAKLNNSIANRSNSSIFPTPITELKGLNFPLSLAAVPETIGPESMDERSNAEWHEQKFDFSDWKLPGKVIDNGFTAFHALYGQDGPGVGLVGGGLFVIRDGLRQITSIEDEGRPFPSCFGLRRIGQQLMVTCDAQRESLTSSKWIRKNWLLVYDDHGRPAKKITFRFDQSSLANGFVSAVRDEKFIGNDRIAATAFISRKINGRLIEYTKAEVVFRVSEEPRN